MLLLLLRHFFFLLQADVVGRHDSVDLLIVFEDAESRQVLTLLKEGFEAIARVNEVLVVLCHS